MAFREKVICNRCEAVTIYTNKVEYDLWRERAGCPACYRAEHGGDIEEMPMVEPSGILRSLVEVRVLGQPVRVETFEVDLNAGCILVRANLPPGMSTFFSPPGSRGVDVI